MPVTTWTFGSSLQGWTLRDESTPANGSNSSLSHDSVTLAAEQNAFIPAINGSLSRGWLLSPPLSILTAIGDTISMDVSALTGYVLNPTTRRVRAVFSDATEENFAAVGAGATTVTLVIASVKTLVRIELVAVEVGNGGANEESDLFCDTLEVRLTTVADPVDYDLVGSGSGLAPKTLVPSKDGAYLFFATEEDATGNQIVVRIDRPTSTSPITTPVYSPAAGSSNNITETGDADRMVFYGNYGAGVGVIDHAIAAATNTDISPAAVGAKLVQPLSVNPAYIGNILAWMEDDEDLLSTDDLGANWGAIRTDAGVVTVIQDMDVLFHGSFQDHNVYFVGDGAGGVKVYESLDGGVTLTSLEDAALNTAADVVGVTVVGV